MIQLFRDIDYVSMNHYHTLRLVHKDSLNRAHSKWARGLEKVDCIWLLLYELHCSVSSQYLEYHRNTSLPSDE